MRGYGCFGAPSQDGSISRLETWRSALQDRSGCILDCRLDEWDQRIHRGASERRGRGVREASVPVYGLAEYRLNDPYLSQRLALCVR